MKTSWFCSSVNINWLTIYITESWRMIADNRLWFVWPFWKPRFLNSILQASLKDQRSLLVTKIRLPKAQKLSRLHTNQDPKRGLIWISGYKHSQTMKVFSLEKFFNESNLSELSKQFVSQFSGLLNKWFASNKRPKVVESTLWYIVCQPPFKLNLKLFGSCLWL